MLRAWRWVKAWQERELQWRWDVFDTPSDSRWRRFDRCLDCVLRWAFLVTLSLLVVTALIRGLYEVAS